MPPPWRPARSVVRPRLPLRREVARATRREGPPGRAAGTPRPAPARASSPSRRRRPSPGRGRGAAPRRAAAPARTCPCRAAPPSRGGRCTACGRVWSVPTAWMCPSARSEIQTCSHAGGMTSAGCGRARRRRTARSHRGSGTWTRTQRGSPGPRRARGRASASAHATRVVGPAGAASTCSARPATTLSGCGASRSVRTSLARVAGDAELLRALAQLGHGPVVVVASHFAAARPTVLRPCSGGGVRDARRLLLRGALVAELFVELAVLELFDPRPWGMAPSLRSPPRGGGCQRPLPPVTGSTAPDTYEAASLAR